MSKLTDFENQDWILPNLHRKEYQIAKENFGRIPQFILKILNKREILKLHEIEEYLYPSLFHMYSPFYFKDMVKAVERIEQAIDNKEAVLIFGDRDADGITATSVLYKILTKYLPQHVAFRVPEGNEEYSISRDTIDWAKLEGYQLIITVDCGITSVEEIRYANQHLIDVIVTDHHEAPQILPEAYAVIDPKSGESGYPFPHLCGAAVAFKLGSALLEKKYLADDFQKEIVFYDLETTGLDPDHDEIFEIGAIKTVNGVETNQFETFVKTEKPLGSESESLSGIKNDEVQNKGIPLCEALSQFLEFTGDAVLAGHNIVNFDQKFIINSLKKCGMKQPENHLIDTLRMSQNILKRLPNHKLSTVARHFGHYVDSSTIHRSIADTRMCAWIYRGLKLYQNDYIREMMQELIPLVSIGTVADIMPLISENRNIVKNGFKYFKHSSTGLIQLMRKLKINYEQISSKDISHQISPILNSAGRLGNAALSVQLLINNKINESSAISDSLLEKNSKRKDIVNEGFEEVQLLVEYHKDDHHPFLFAASEKIQKGTTGLLASKILDNSHSVAVVISLYHDADDNHKLKANGSMRSYAPFNVMTILDSLADIFEHYGGHPQAGGFSIDPDKIDDLYEKLIDYFKNYPVIAESQNIDIDVEIDRFSEISLNDIRHLNYVLDPVGNHNPEASLFFTKISILQVNIIGRTKLHCQLKAEKSNSLADIMSWNSSEELQKFFKIYPISDFFYDIIVTPDINTFRGNESIRFTLKHIRPHLQASLKRK